MAILYQADLNSANNSNMTLLLKDTISKSDTIKNVISEFINNSSSVLQGRGYDSVRTKLTMYVDALNKLKIISENLLDAIYVANNTMINYMDGYAELDNGKISQVSAELESAKATLAWLEAYSLIWKQSSNGSWTSSWVQNGTASQISAYRDLVNELQKLYDKLVGLAGADSGAFNNVANVSEDSINLVNAINGISTGVFGGDEISRKVDANLLSDEIKALLPSSNTTSVAGLKYTREQIESMDEATVKSMSKDEFFDFVGAAAVLAYQEKGGVLPSVTIAQACLETGYGKSFTSTSNNLYGLKGYPGEKPTVGGGLRQFDSFYESTCYHTDYFFHYQDKCYNNFMKCCENGDALGACSYLGAYCGGSTKYGPDCKWIIQEYDLTRYDKMVLGQ